nr:hypothetical protein [uncultured bacterium]
MLAPTFINLCPRCHPIRVAVTSIESITSVASMRCPSATMFHLLERSFTYFQPSVASESSWLVIPRRGASSTLPYRP